MRPLACCQARSSGPRGHEAVAGLVGAELAGTGLAGTGLAGTGLAGTGLAGRDGGASSAAPTSSARLPGRSAGSGGGVPPNAGQIA
jgi:hypothetical protein